MAAFNDDDLARVLASVDDEVADQAISAVPVEDLADVGTVLAAILGSAKQSEINSEQVAARLKRGADATERVEKLLIGFEGVAKAADIIRIEKSFEKELAVLKGLAFGRFVARIFSLITFLLKLLPAGRIVALILVVGVVVNELLEDEDLSIERVQGIISDLGLENFFRDILAELNEKVEPFKEKVNQAMFLVGDVSIGINREASALLSTIEHLYDNKNLGDAVFGPLPELAGLIDLARQNLGNQEQADAILRGALRQVNLISDLLGGRPANPSDPDRATGRDTLDNLLTNSVLVFDVARLQVTESIDGILAVIKELLIEKTPSVPETGLAIDPRIPNIERGSQGDTVVIGRRKKLKRKK